ncbi:MAG: hypothetical protein RLZZ262_380, partial [Bacteroidota bacterium]
MKSKKARFYEPDAFITPTEMHPSGANT